MSIYQYSHFERLFHYFMSTFTYISLSYKNDFFLSPCSRSAKLNGFDNKEPTPVVDVLFAKDWNAIIIMSDYNFYCYIFES